MDNKITTTRLAAILSETTGKQKKLCEDFLKEFFKVVSAELEKGENVRVKGFGTFKISEIEARKSVSVSTGDEVEIPGHKRVLFVPAKELAAIVNAPFAAFEASEVEDDISTELLTGEDFPEFFEDVLSATDEDSSVPEDEEIVETKEEEVTETFEEETPYSIDEEMADTETENTSEEKETVGDWMESMEGSELSEESEMISTEEKETVGDWMESMEGSEISEEINHEAEKEIAYESQEFVADEPQEFVADAPQEFVADEPQEFVADEQDEFVADAPQEFVADEQDEFVADEPQEFVADEQQEYAIENLHDFMNDEPQEYDLGESMVYNEDETQDYFPDDTNDLASEESSVWSKEDTSAFSVKKIRKKIFGRRKKEKRDARDARPAYNDSPEYRHVGRHRFLYGFLTGLLIALIIGVLLFVFVGMKPIEDEFYRQGVEDAMLELSKLQTPPAEDDSGKGVPNIAQSQATEVLPGAEVAGTEANAATVAQGDASGVPTQASDARVYDTVSTTRYLTTMAREHYGNMDLWPIIYEENKAILGHPDKITPGTRVRIPSLRKYHVSATNPDDVKRIKAKGEEIYRRYRVKR